MGVPLLNAALLENFSQVAVAPSLKQFLGGGVAERRRGSIQGSGIRASACLLQRVGNRTELRASASVRISPKSQERMEENRDVEVFTASS